MRDELCTYIGKDLLNLDVNDAILPDQDLLDDGMVDSLGMIQLLTHIQEHYQYTVPAEDFLIENFCTVDAIVAYLERSMAVDRP